MNPQTHRVIFNKSRGCMMAVSEVASGQGKGKSNKFRKSHKSRSKRCKKPASAALSTPRTIYSHVYSLNSSQAQTLHSGGNTTLAGGT